MIWDPDIKPIVRNKCKRINDGGQGEAKLPDIFCEKQPCIQTRYQDIITLTMSVKAFQGAELTGYERDAIRRLRDLLRPLEKEYYLLANVQPVPIKNPSPHIQIDVLIFGPDRVFLIEIKRISDKHGNPVEVWERDDGQWETESKVISTTPPKDQVIDQYRNFKKWIAQDQIRRKVFLRADLQEQFSEEMINDIKKFIAIYPKRHPQSEGKLNTYKSDPNSGYQITENRGGVINFDDIPEYLESADYKSNFAFGTFANEEKQNLAKILAPQPLFGSDDRPQVSLSERTASDSELLSESGQMAKNPRRPLSNILIRVVLALSALIVIAFAGYGLLKDTVTCAFAATPEELQSRGDLLEGKSAWVKFQHTTAGVYGEDGKKYMYIRSRSSNGFSVYIPDPISDAESASLRSFFEKFQGQLIAMEGTVYPPDDDTRWQIKVEQMHARNVVQCS